jgi:hypothetical protein
MHLTDMLRKLGDRLGIIELAPASRAPSTPVKIQTRTVTLAELVTRIQVREVRELAELPAELSVPFDEVYSAAGIQTPPSGWTVNRLEEFLKSDAVQGLTRSDAQRETLRALGAAGVNSADVIKDAVARDQAMDAFEEGVARKRELWLAGKKQLLLALETQIHGLQEEQRRVAQEVTSEEKNWTEWRRRKIQRETDMAHAVSYLIDKPVISIDSE